MTATRDILEAPAVVGSDMGELARLLGLQNDYLQDIAIYLRRQNADVLCSTVVKGTSQLTNAIGDTNSHEVVFEVGGKPAEIYHLIAFSTWGHTVGLSVLSMANINDGIPLAYGDVYDLSVPTNSVYIMAPSATLVAPLIVNGPTNPAAGEESAGGLFLYGYTIPDWDRIRNATRS